MPHEVIMPALGMAQDTGKIVRWLKKSGDPVSSGEAIMEVETDKAVMEVEAAADGFLSGVLAGDGADVPVGSVVAVIVDSEGEVEDAKRAADAGGEAVATSGDAGDETLPEGAEIIMPALGMAQDTGLIVNWCKGPGDKVSASDILLEVETDKSVMEVEAGHDGYVAAILAETQEAVPVGSVIAVISVEKPESPVRRSGGTHVKPTGNGGGSPEGEKPALAETGPQKMWSAASVPGRILASPKARRLASEEGLDLSLLADQAVPQPFHASDIKALRELKSRPAPAETAPAIVPLRIEARVPASGFEAFSHWLEEEGGNVSEPERIWLSFASAALRTANGTDETIVVGTLKAGAKKTTLFADADRIRLGTSLDGTGDGEADMILRDLTKSSVVRATARARNAPVLTVGRDRGDFLIGFDYHDGQLSEVAALAFVAGFAGRLEEPLRHLL